MKRVGVFVGEQENWTFFQDYFDYLTKHYEIEVYRERVYSTPLLHGRLNRWAYRRQIRSILTHSDLCFFEWASGLLETASHMPKYCPIVTRLHSFEIYTWAPRINWNNVDKVILVSQAMRQKFNDLYPEHAHKTAVVYNAVRLDEFRAGPRQFNNNIGMLCSITPRKRIYEVIMMVHEMKKAGHDVHLHVAGRRVNGPNYSEYYVACHRLVEKLRVEECISFYGHVAQPASWLQDIDIYVSNSFWEGHQVSLVEAMSAGCYCLSHFWDGAEEVLPAENLYTTEAELMQKILEYLNEPDNEKQRREAQMRSLACENYNIEDAKRRIRAIIDEVWQSNGQ